MALKSMPLAIAAWILAAVWSLWSIWTWTPLQRAWAGFGNRPYKESAPKNAPSANLWLQNFGLLYRGQIQFVHFADLWNSDGTPNDDPRIMFGFTIINNTPYTVRITGVNGSVTFDGLTNTRGDATLGTEWYQCGPFSRSEVHIYQPFSPERGRNLIERIEQKKTIRFDFPAVVLSGTIIELAQPMPKVQASMESVDVDPTAISRTSAQVNVWHILPAKR